MKIFAAAALGVAIAVPAGAQELASTFDQLRVLVKAGDVLTITDATGGQTSGTLTALTSSTLGIDAKDGPRSFSEADVSTVRQQRHGDLAKGAKIGFGVGAGFGVLGAMAVGVGCRNCAGLALSILGVYGAMGAGVGVGISAMTTHQQVIFSRAPAATRRVTVAPLVTRERQGVMMSVGF